MTYENLERGFADATGFLVDRTQSPPKLLGQAFLVSRSRAVSCASSVFNYTEAPWALGFNLVHPDIVLGIKAIALHNEFDKREARNWYLHQTGLPGEELALPNDIASLVLDAELSDVSPEKLAELKGALTVPYSGTEADQSGVVGRNEYIPLINSILEAKVSGLLTLYDARNIPVARIEIREGNLTKILYRNLTGEMAFLELLYRRPAESFSFSTTNVTPIPITNSGANTFQWSAVKNIATPTGALLTEAARRANDIAQMFNYLGGPESRYQKVVKTFNPTSAAENIRWLVERLWEVIDGYITLDKLPERMGADTYSVLQIVRELVNRGVISQINKATPFHASGQLGTPIISHTDFEIHAWDALQSFYLDPLSGRPVWLQGNFFGVANALQPKNMLHTIPIPPKMPGALILKDYKLIGVHSAAQAPKPGQPTPPVQCYQFMWMGALLDMSTKKLRTDMEEDGATTLRSKMESTTEVPELVQPVKLAKFVCPKCHSTNTQLGPCFNCGTILEPPPPEPEPEGKVEKAKVLVSDKLQELHEKYGITKLHLMGGGAGLVILFIIVLALMPPPKSKDQPIQVLTKTVEEQASHGDTEKATKYAVEYAGFKGTSMPGYWYQDTSQITKPNKSFGLFSKTNNQKLLFIIYDGLTPVENLVNFVAQPPFVPDILPSNPDNVKIDEGAAMIGIDQMHWFLGKYAIKSGEQAHGDLYSDNQEGTSNSSMRILLASFPCPSPNKGKSILLIGIPFTPEVPYDHKVALWVVDQMAIGTTTVGNDVEEENKFSKQNVVSGKAKTTSSTTLEKPIATDKDIDNFAKKVESSIQAKLSFPEEVNKKSKKMKVTINVGIANDGSVAKLDITQPSDSDKITNSVVKAINSASPFAEMPRIKEDMLTLVVKLHGEKIKVESP